MPYTFYVGSSPTDDSCYPAFYLSKTKWDDYGFSTSFTLYYMEELGSKQLIGPVKIGLAGQTSGRTPVPTEFPNLELPFFSLGQSEAYYERLKSLGTQIKTAVLKALQDVTSSSAAMRIAENENVYSSSLIRFLGPLALAGLGNQDKDVLRFEFESFIHNSDLSTHCVFSFRKDELIPNRINALIGVNGAGKTQLLGKR